jgi:hypothetical protein
LRPAYEPCPNFKKACKDYCLWIPQDGHVPRAFGGATGAISDIRLILVTAEPGDPADGEKYHGSPDEMLHASMSMLIKCLREDNLRRNGKAARFHKNLRKILDLCWPGDSLEDQLRKTWITPAVLCSAEKSTGVVPRKIENTCVSTYLVPQINLLENAFVIALGGKARDRLNRNRVRKNFDSYHPSLMPKDQPKGEESWKQAAQAFQRWLKLHGFQSNDPGDQRSDRSDKSKWGAIKNGLKLAVTLLIGAYILWGEELEEWWRQRRKTGR